jgi:hypothetical protein
MLIEVGAMIPEAMPTHWQDAGKTTLTSNLFCLKKTANKAFS